ncbi:MAG: NusG domain II-containing protein [Eubacteriales bacterium]
MRKKEVIVGLIVIATLIVIIGLQLSHSTQGKEIEITWDGEVYGTYSLIEEQVIVMESGNTLVIESGEVYMESATCKNQLCVKQGRVGQVGEAIVCLPHKVVVQVNEE